MQTHSTWADWFIDHANNDAGNRNLEAFSNILSSGDSNKAKLWALVEEIDTVILAADLNKNIMIFAFSQELWRHKVPSQKQSCLHARHWPSSNLHPPGPKHCFSRYPNRCSNGSRPSRMRISQRSRQHTITRRKRPCRFQRICHLHPGPSSSEHNHLS